VEKESDKNFDTSKTHSKSYKVKCTLAGLFCLIACSFLFLEILMANKKCQETFRQVEQSIIEGNKALDDMVRLSIEKGINEVYQECPYCKGLVRYDATKCPHCGSELSKYWWVDNPRQ